MGGKKMAKKLGVLLVVLSVVFVVVLSACGKSKSPAAPAATATTVPLSEFATWDTVTPGTIFDARMWPSVMVFNNKVWVIAGMQDPGGTYYNDVWSTTDCGHWTQETASANFSPRFRQSCTVYNGKMWLIGGSHDGNDANNDVWSSSNGVDWTLVTGNAAFGPRFAHKTVVYNGKLWVVSGQDSSTMLKDAWYSTNGADWFAATRNANFLEGMVNFGLIVFKGKMWIMCGETNGQKSKLVYNSTDGITWTAIVNVPFLDKVAPTYYVYGNMLYLGNGHSDAGSGVMADMWRTADGYSWELVADPVSYGGIMKQAAVNFNGKVYLIGGSTDSDTGWSVNNVYVNQ